MRTHLDVVLEILEISLAPPLEVMFLTSPFFYDLL